MAVSVDSPTARYGDLCRLCATKTGLIPKGLNIFANEANYRQIFKKIEACLPLQISETDVLPKIVCENCLFKIELLFDFRERALRTQGVLIELFKQLHSHPLQIHNGTHHSQHLKLDIALEHVISQQNALLSDGLVHVSDMELPQLSHRDSMIILSQHSIPLDQLSQHDINQELSNHSIDTSESILGGPNGYSAMDYHHPSMLHDDINLSHASMHQIKTMVEHDTYGTSSMSDLGHVKNIGCNGVQRLMMNEAHFMHNNLAEEENFDSLNAYMFCTTCGKSFDDKISLQQHYEEHYNKPCNAFTHEKEIENAHRKELHGSCSTTTVENSNEVDEHEHESLKVEHHERHQTRLNTPPESEDVLPVHMDDLSIVPVEAEPDPEPEHEHEHELEPEPELEPDPEPEPEPEVKQHSERLKSEQYSDADSDREDINLDDQLEDIPERSETPEPEQMKEQELEPDASENGTKRKNKAVPKICSVCGKQYKTNYKLTEHMRKHTGEQPYKCNSCDKGFRSKIGLAQHEATHTGQYEFSCPTCGKGFQCRSYLMVHQRVHSDVKPFSCTTCNRGFKTKQSLLDHTNRHLGLKPYACDICRRSFITNGLLKAHQKVHTGADNRKYACSVCDKMFVSKSYLQIHTRIHTGEKPFKCEVCGRGFQASFDLKVHSTMHTGEKSYVCEMCGKAFARRDALRCHRRSHTGERPYKCDICGQTFTQFSPMTIHKRLHTGERPYPCEICGEKFVSRSTMMVHFRKHVKNDVKKEISERT